MLVVEVKLEGKNSSTNSLIKSFVLHVLSAIFALDTGQVELSKFIANLKTVSSRLICKEIGEDLSKIYKKPVFWTGSYFVTSCGG
ncbi:MAG: transposase [Kastovskya adunca ATA6-11-RM4]|jgi:hypothetical protein|nr:transposase [Kastovskya adunca ATA6-11-RM4]